MPFSTIDRSSDYFRIKLYTGDDTTNRSITFDESKNMQPDFTWIKSRSNAYYHELYDVVRGFSSSTNGRVLYTNTTGAEGTPNTFNSFNTNGFTVSKQTGEVGTNATGATFSSWSWKANGTGVSNTSGTITSTVSANTTSGFSIVSYTGTGANATVGHGLGVAPSMIIFKSRNSATSWVTYHKSLGATNFVALSNTDASSASSLPFNNTAPTSSVFSIGTSGGTNSTSMIAFCWSEVKGFSKFGSYTGNGNADGTFVYTGFSVGMVIIKSSTYSGSNWHIFDNKRYGYNDSNYVLKPDTSDSEFTQSSVKIDLLSNGFKLRGTDVAMNQSGGTLIYMAFASNPFVSSKGLPTTAR
jgi:hypothetical protein